MLDDYIDRLVGQKKTYLSVAGRIAKLWPALWRGALVATTAVASWASAASLCSPTENDVRDLEIHRTQPIIVVGAVESFASRNGEMILTIDFSNIGHLESDLSFEIRPSQPWVSFGPQSAIKIDPAMPVSAQFTPGLALIQIPRPIVPGLDASVTISGIKATPPPKFKYEDGLLGVNTFAGKYPTWLRWHVNLHPALRPATKTDGATSPDAVGSRAEADSAGIGAVP